MFTFPQETSGRSFRVGKDLLACCTLLRRSTAPMNRLPASSPDFSPGGCSSCPSGQWSRDEAPFLPGSPLPLPLAFGSRRLGRFRLPGCLLATVLHRMDVCTAPETVTFELLGLRLLVLALSALLASCGLGKGVRHVHLLAEAARSSVSVSRVSQRTKPIQPDDL